MGSKAGLAGVAVAVWAVAGTVQASDVVSADGGVRVSSLSSDGSAQVEVRSAADGWSCRGVYAAPGQNGATVRFPLACTDDVTGDAMMSVDRETGRAALIFKREDGDRGSAAFLME